MKSIVAAAFLLVLVAHAQTVVQSSSRTGAAPGPITLTLGTAPAAGHAVLVHIGYDVSVGDVTLPPPGTWVQLAPCPVQTNQRIDTWMHFVQSGEPGSYTFTPSNPHAALNGTIMEISGVNAVNQQACSGAGRSSAIASPSVTPTAVGTLAIASISPDTNPCSYKLSPGWKEGPLAHTEYHSACTAIRTALTRDTTTAISNTFTGGNGGNSVQNIILFSPAGTAPVFSYQALPGGTMGTAYNAALAISGGTPPYTCSGTGMPPGLTLSLSCVFSGNPGAPATYTPTISVTDSSANPRGNGTTSSRITIVPEPPLTFAGTYSGKAEKYLNDSFRVGGGYGPYTCRITGPLPPGLVLGGIGNCGFVGTPAVAGTTSVTLAITDSSHPVMTSSGAATFTMAPADPPLPRTAGSLMTLGPLGSLGTFVMSPNDAWHADISNAAVDPKSHKITVPGAGNVNNQAGSHLHPDFGAYGAGIPYIVVDSSQTPGVPVTWTAGYQETEGDTTLYPIPANIPIEGSPAECTTQTDDRHANVIDRHTSVLYEIYQLEHCTQTTPFRNQDHPAGIRINAAGSGWAATNGAVWDMLKTQQRPYNDTSVDAAGLSVFEGLLTYDDILRGYVNHAIRFTMAHTSCDHYSNGDGQAGIVFPATHGACNGTEDVAIGMRLRLKASFDVSGYSATNQIILNGIKKYGLILADNGGPMFIQGTPDPRWNDADINHLKKIATTDFEVVAMQPYYTADHTPSGRKPVIRSFTASAKTIPPGTPVTLTAITVGESYKYTDNGGVFTSDTQTVTPSATTTYILHARNAFGDAVSSLTIKVSAAVR